MISRCPWCKDDPLYLEYHDKQWGVPLHDEKLLFEMLVLEGAQAGLSWITILKKRDGYRKAFDDFDPEKVALYKQNDVERLMNNNGIVRNRLKIQSAINNAKRFLEIEKEFGSFDKFIWSFTGGKSIKNSWEKLEDIPCKSELSDKISKELKKRGFSFVGSTICYSFMQAIGVVNDHLKSCFRYNA